MLKGKPLIPHNIVLLRAGRRKDTPGSKYSIVFSFNEKVSALKSLVSRVRARSKFAVRDTERPQRVRFFNYLKRVKQD